MVSLRPLYSLRVSRHQIPAHDLVPNTSIQHHPLLIYHNAFTSGTNASAIERHIRGMGIAEPQWRFTMYSKSHFHSTVHELLVVVRGKADLCFGGEENPGRIETTVASGDVMIVPAGVAHRLMRDVSESEGEFEMVGAYEVGKSWDMSYGVEGEERKIEGIKNVGWWKVDPIYGKEGPTCTMSNR